jgi:Ca2+-binding RTX toxin-like protein
MRGRSRGLGLKSRGESRMSPDPRQGGHEARRTYLLLAAMVLTLVATSGTALAQVATPGNDLIHGSGGNNLLTGGKGDDAVHGGSGDDRVEGNAGDDLVTGGWGDDAVFGGWGRDEVVGGSGDDALWGGSGADAINAHDGFVDVISCGAGSRDLVFYDGGLDSVAADCEDARVSVTSFRKATSLYCRLFPRRC